MSEHYPTLPAEIKERALARFGIDIEKSTEAFITQIRTGSSRVFRQETADIIPLPVEVELPVVQLTPREGQVLLLAARGLSMKEIAETVQRSQDVVKAQLKAARQRLGARNTTHAVALMYELAIQDAIAA